MNKEQREALKIKREAAQALRARCEEAFKKQKHMPMHAQRKIQEGQWVEVKWSDVPNSMALVIAKDGTGYRIFKPDYPDYHPWIDREQVVACHGDVIVPPVGMGQQVPSVTWTPVANETPTM